MNVGGALLSRVLGELSGASQAAMHAAYLRHGDLGGAAQELLQTRTLAATLAIADVGAAFAAIAAAGKPAVKQRLVFGAAAKATPLEAKYLIKIILGDMRTGIKVTLVEEAIAAAYSAPVAQVRNARMLNGNLPEVLELAAAGRLEEATDEALPSPRLYAGQSGRDGGGGVGALLDQRSANGRQVRRRPSAGALRLTRPPGRGSLSSPAPVRI